jgi:hypothetical protein
MDMIGTVKLFQTEFYFGWERSDCWAVTIVSAGAGFILVAMLESECARGVTGGETGLETLKMLRIPRTLGTLERRKKSDDQERGRRRGWHWRRVGVSYCHGLLWGGTFGLC